MSANVAATARRLADIATFTQTVARIEADATCSASQKMTAIYQQHETSRSQLAALGLLDAHVAQELAAIVTAAENAIAGQNAEFGSALQTVLAAYTPPPEAPAEKIKHIWHTKILPWWRDDSW